MAEWCIAGGRQGRVNKPDDFRNETPDTISRLMRNPDVQHDTRMGRSRPGQWVGNIKHYQTIYGERIPHGASIAGEVSVDNPKVVEQLVIYRLIYTIYFRLLRAYYRRRIQDPRKPQINIQKEFDDAVSNAVISAGYKNFQDVILRHFDHHVDLDYTDWRPHIGWIDDKSKVQILKVAKGSYAIRYRYSDGATLSIASYGERMGYMLELGAAYEDALMCLLLAYNGRFHSGSNWSPKESYPDIHDAKYADYIKVECYSSGWNCQNYFEYVSNGHKFPDKPLVDHILTRYPEEDMKIFPNVAGTWPSTCWEILQVNLSDSTGSSTKESEPKFYLMVNPIYTEKDVCMAIEEMHAMWTRYGDRLAFRCTFPFWTDIIDGAPNKEGVVDKKWKDLLAAMGMVVTANTKSTVRNFQTNMEIPLRFYTAQLN